MFNGRDKIRIYEQKPYLDEDGATRESWSLIREVRADVAPATSDVRLGTEQRFEHGGSYVSKFYTITIRFIAVNFAAVRMEFDEPGGTQILRANRVTDFNNRHMWLSLMCEAVTDGI